MRSTTLSAPSASWSSARRSASASSSRAMTLSCGRSASAIPSSSAASMRSTAHGHRKLSYRRRLYVPIPLIPNEVGGMRGVFGGARSISFAPRKGGEHGCGRARWKSSDFAISSTSLAARRAATASTSWRAYASAPAARARSDRLPIPRASANAARRFRSPCARRRPRAGRSKPSRGGTTLPRGHPARSRSPPPQRSNRLPP